jgi:hypothetical protein
MATHDYVISNASGAAVRADLNNALAAIVSNNSSATEPSTTYSYMLWADTGSSPPVMKLRNAANSGWVTLFQLDGEWSVIPFENGTAAAPSIYFKDSGTDTGLFSGGTDQVNITTGGTERVEWGTSEVVFNDGGENYDFRIEGDTNSSLFFVDASTDRVGIGTTSPDFGLDVNGTVGITEGSPVSWHDGSGNLAARIYATSGDELRFDRGSGASRSLTIDSSGRLLVGTSSVITNGWGGTGGLFQVAKNDFLPIGLFTYSSTAADGYCPYFELHRARGSQASPTIVSSGDELGEINFYGHDGSTFTRGASIRSYVDGTPGANDMPGRLAFYTTSDGSSSPTERMRITNDGALLVNNTSGSAGNNGFIVAVTGESYCTASSNRVFRVNRLVDDGTLVDLVQANVTEGTISVSGNTVSYNQFLGSHWAALTDWSRPEIKIGTILETINELTDWKYAVIEVEGEQKKICYNGTEEIGSTVTVEYEGEEYEGIVELETNPKFNKAVKVKVNDTAASKAVYGVFVGWNTDKSGDGGIWNDMYVGAVGNYVIRMAAGQEPEIGDLVEADGTGCAVVQDDDIIRTKTVAKITSTIPQVTYDDGSFLVTCVLYCG